MTYVRYSPSEFHIRVEGHAGAAKPGEDLVCAAVSTLGWTMIANASEDPDYGMHLYLNEAEGVMDLRCYPQEEKEEDCGKMLQVIMIGFEAVAEKYPEYVTIGGSYGN